jgi:hypothetical protein
LTLFGQVVVAFSVAPVAGCVTPFGMPNMRQPSCAHFGNVSDFHWVSFAILVGLTLNAVSRSSAVTGFLDVVHSVSNVSRDCFGTSCFH